MWDAISSNTQLKWDNISGIQGIVGNNDDIVASVMLFLYLRDNYPKEITIQQLSNKTGNFGYNSIETLINVFKREVFQGIAKAMGDEFFKLKDSQSKVKSILRMTLLGQRLNRVFFFLARYHKCIYFGYKRSRGEGYDFANEIGLTDEEFKEMMEKSGTDIPDKIKQLHKDMMRKIHGDKSKYKVPVKITTYDYKREDGVIVQLAREVNLRDDRDYPFKRYNAMYMEFKKWFDLYKMNSSYLKEERKYFKPVENVIDWDMYEDGTLHTSRYKEWFDI